MKPALKSVGDELQAIDADSKTLHGAMAAAFAEIEAATKDKTNPHFKSKYADLGSVIDAIKPPLIKYGLFFAQRSHPAESGVSVETILYHRGGQELSLGTLFVPANKQDAQGFGSALTYARRYGLMTAFGVPAEDDDGIAASRNQAQSIPGGLGNGNGNGHKAAMTEARDAPFPLGPAKNKTECKDMGRKLWADVMSCEDKSTLDALLISHKPLIDQLKAALPQWWGGGTRDGEAYEGLGQVIEKLERDFDGVAASGMDMRGNTVPA